jgi:hypothetical protein
MIILSAEFGKNEIDSHLTGGAAVTEDSRPLDSVSN